MPIVTVSQPTDGTTADAADVNNQVNAILAVLNGHVDQDNLADAGVTNAKLAGSIDVSKLAANVGAGWTPGLATPNTVIALGNRSYTLTVNSTDLTGTLSPGMRLKLTRTVAAPTKSTSLNGTTQYYSLASASITGMTFVGSHTTMAWVKLSAYPSTQAGIIGRTDNSTGGFHLQITTDGRVRAFYGTASTFTDFFSYQSIPLNKWVHIAASVNAASKTVVMLIDGVVVPTSQTLSAAASVTQVGNLEIGRGVAAYGLPTGKIAQAAIFSTNVATATIQSYISQTLAGTETSLISAYSFNNSITDLNANANNLTANGSAVATATDSPFGNSGVSSTLEYGIITANSFSTNTTLTVQVPEGCAIPTSGGVSAVSYSTQAVPYGFPRQRGKWVVTSLYRTLLTQSNPVSGTWYNLTSVSGTSGGTVLTIPVGDWSTKYSGSIYVTNATNPPSGYATLSTANNTESDTDFTVRPAYAAGSSAVIGNAFRAKNLATTVATAYYLNVKTDVASCTGINWGAASEPTIIEAELATL